MATKKQKMRVRGRTYKHQAGAKRAACRVKGKVVKSGRNYKVRVPR